MTKRIPIKAAKDLAKKYGQTHVILFTYDGTNQHIVTYGKSLEACDQAANLGNDIKTALGWPKDLNATPSRVKKLLKQIEILKQEVKVLEVVEQDHLRLRKAWVANTALDITNDGSRNEDVYNRDQ